jgi:hypothetical protein
MAVTRRMMIVAAIAAVALTGGAAYYFFRAPDAAPGVMKQTAGKPAYRTQIDGLRFFETRQGRRVVSITADRFELGRGRIGFFSTGLTRRAMIKNAVIEIYADARQDDPIGAKPAPEGKRRNIPIGENVAFSGLFAGDAFSTLLPVRNTAEIEISPIRLTLRNERTVLTSIAAVRATVLLRDKRILFTGQVRVLSGNAELTTEQLSFIPATSRLQTDRPYILKRGNAVREGAGLSTSIFLRI